MSDEPKDFAQWAIVELMGHVRIAGMVTEEERFGVKMGRCDIPGHDGATFATQYFSGASIYRVTPCTEEAARKIALMYQPKPVALLEEQIAIGDGDPGDAQFDYDDDDDGGYDDDEEDLQSLMDRDRE